uniref:Uncharacterized protein n=1 Tax=Anopheles darlingi TaxID=43151 RepID=A0A2M4D0V9_ANODA
MYILFLLVGFACLCITSIPFCLVVSCSFYTPPEFARRLLPPFTSINCSILLLRTFVYNMNNNFVCDCVLCYVVRRPLLLLFTTYT